MVKKLYRSRRERMLGGVCGGLADYFNIDVTLVRLALVALTLAGGSGSIFYLIGWIIIPEEDLSNEVYTHEEKNGNTG